MQLYINYIDQYTIGDKLKNNRGKSIIHDINLRFKNSLIHEDKTKES